MIDKLTLKKEIDRYLAKNSNYFTRENIKILKEKLSQTISEIPKNAIINPRPNIFIPLLYQLTINNPNSSIGLVLTNLLVAELSESKSKNITPQIIDTIIYISENDINFINDLYQIMNNRKTNNITICFVKEKPLENNPNGLRKGVYEIGRFLIDDVEHKHYNSFDIENLVLENLKRLGLIEIDKENYLAKDEEKIRDTFNKHKNEYDDGLNEIGLEVIVEPGIITITDLGKAVMKECILDGKA